MSASGFDQQGSFARAASRLRRGFVLVALFSAAVNILMLTGPVFMLQLYDRVLSSGSVPTLTGLFVIVVILYFFMGVYDFVRTRMLSRSGYRLDADLGTRAYDTWVRAGMNGGLGTRRPIQDVTIVRSFLASPAMLGIFDLPWIPLYLAVVWYIHPWLGYLATAGALVVLALALINQAITRRPMGEAMMMDAAESFFVEQSHRNAESILPLGMMGNMTRRWGAMHGQGLATGQRGADRSEIITTATKAFRLLLQSAILGLAGFLALRQEITPGMIVAASIIAGRALAPVDQVIGQWRNVLRTRHAWRRLRETLGDDQGLPAPVALPDPKGYLSVRNLLKYAPGARRAARDKPILFNVNFDLEPGDGLGVIGPSASGKSTLARLVVGGWSPDGGEVRLDDAALDQWPTEALGRHIGYLPQKMEMISGTIRDNICRFDPEATDEDVVEAAQLAGVHKMILKLPDGYGTRVDHETMPLSGGQVQRIGLARALFARPRLIVLDEPNAHLDATGDDALAAAIMHMRRAGSVVIVMAHRPSAIAAVNKVAVMHGGTLSDFGPKEEVLKRATTPAEPVHAPEPEAAE